MIVQSAPEGHPRFVIAQTAHARMAGQLAAAFGNDRFAPLDPAEPLIFCVAHHDEGWAALDAQARQDPATGLPYHLTQTPLAELVATGAGSPDFNARHHPLSGLISSMHTWGLYHGRYGLSDFLFIDRITPELRPRVDAMLQGELDRQAHLKLALAADPALKDRLSEAHIFHYYKLLQFFDTLALYFHTTHAALRGEAAFRNVPRAVGDDVTVTIRPAGEGRYAVTPYPFAVAPLEVWVAGHTVAPQPAGADLAGLLAAAPVERQVYTLVAEG